MGLHDMMEIEDPELLSYIPDYRINLISPYSISDISLDQFHTSLREVLLFIKYSKDKNRLRKIVAADPHFLSVDRKAGQVIKILTGSDFEIREEEEKIDMCKALEDLKEEGRQEGWQEGRQDGIRKLILKILAKNQFSYEEIADMTEMSVEEIMEIDRSAAGQQ